MLSSILAKIQKNLQKVSNILLQYFRPYLILFGSVNWSISYLKTVDPAGPWRRKIRLIR